MQQLPLFYSAESTSHAGDIDYPALRSPKQRKEHLTQVDSRQVVDLHASSEGCEGQNLGISQTAKDACVIYQTPETCHERET